MSSCSHFSNFLSDPIGKQSAMSKVKKRLPVNVHRWRNQQKPMVPAKARPVNMVLSSPWSARENPPQDLGNLVNPGNVDDGQGSQTGTRRLVRATQNSEIECSQVRR